MPYEPVTDPQAGGIPSDDQRPSAEQLVEENQKLRSKLANSEEENRKAQSVVDISRSIYAAPGGKEIFERARAAMDKGTELTFTEKQEAKLEKTAEATGLTAEQVQSIVEQGLVQHERSLAVTGKAEKAIAKLHQRGIKELEGYEGMFETDAFNNMMSHTLEAMQPRQDQEGRQYTPALATPEDERDPYWFAVKHTHAMLTAGAKAPKGKKSTEPYRRAAIAGQQTTPAGGPTETSDPDSPDLAWAKTRGSRTVGRSFADG